MSDSIPIQGGTMRPGLTARPDRPARVREPQTAAANFDETGIRLRLIEGAFFEVADALQASADELFDGLLKVVDRLTWRNPYQGMCRQCHRVVKCEHGRGHFCSPACQTLFQAEQDA